MLYLGVAGKRRVFTCTQWCVLWSSPPACTASCRRWNFFRAGGASVLTALLRALYLPGGVGTAPALSRCGLLAFFFCTCLALPRPYGGDEQRGHAGLVSAGHHAGMHGPAGRGLRAEHYPSGDDFITAQAPGECSAGRL